MAEMELGCFLQAVRKAERGSLDSVPAALTAQLFPEVAVCLLTGTLPACAERGREVRGRRFPDLSHSVLAGARQSLEEGGDVGSTVLGVHQRRLVKRVYMQASREGPGCARCRGKAQCSTWEHTDHDDLGTGSSSTRH